MLEELTRSFEQRMDRDGCEFGAPPDVLRSQQLAGLQFLSWSLEAFSVRGVMMRQDARCRNAMWEKSASLPSTLIATTVPMTSGEAKVQEQS